MVFLVEITAGAVRVFAGWGHGWGCVEDCWLQTAAGWIPDVARESRRAGSRLGVGGFESGESKVRLFLLELS